MHLTANLNLAQWWFGPVATTWFKFLQNKIVFKNKNVEILARVGLLIKLNVCQLQTCSVFLSSMAIMEGGSPKGKVGEEVTETALT